MKGRLRLGIAAIVCLAGPSLAAVSGTVRAARDVQVADTSIVPQANTVGDYTRVDPHLTATRWMREFTVETADGRRIKVLEERSVELSIGAKVTVESADGHDRIVPK